VAVVMHESSLWMLDKEEGLSGDLTGCSSGRRSDGCSGAARSGGGDDLSSGERESSCAKETQRKVENGLHCEAPSAFYRAEEVGEMVPWRRNGWR
jgi:hypothetical protein